MSVKCAAEHFPLLVMAQVMVLAWLPSFYSFYSFMNPHVCFDLCVCPGWPLEIDLFGATGAGGLQLEEAVA